MGDFNNDISKANVETDKLEDFFCLLDLIILIDLETCFIKNHKSLTDFILKNRRFSFQHTKASETGLSDFHKLISSTLICQYSRVKPKVIHYRNY